MGCISFSMALLLVKKYELDETPVKNGLIPAVVQMMSAWFVNNGCNFMKFVE